ncbi:putative manganese efflux pump MntP [Paraliobacillus sp. PM-2]|uniref:manganese efflux pump MntP n=1 Tax=Paraliobacillus sp. PM-2 TaxID=1462524 RepID=UPI00061C9ED9|nr:manganese efflux pump MntP family protein [Paraliobacillus sp. PM-2]CQR46153.1 putative manganese efflux pump MntP [Paraliobacillus sp. PM-2]
MIELNGTISLLIMAIALGMDAFSVGLGMGLQLLRLKRIFFIGVTVGIFHIIMPFIGMIVGRLISTQLEGAAILCAGLLLFGLGIHMMLQTFQEERKQPMKPIGIGLFLFSFSVSMDSFSVGLSLGMSGVKILLSLILFGIMSMILTWSGLLLGRKARGLLGVYSELLGGTILCGFGLHFIFG